MLTEHWNGFLRAVMNLKCPQWSICPCLALRAPCGQFKHHLTSFGLKMSLVVHRRCLSFRGAGVSQHANSSVLGLSFSPHVLVYHPLNSCSFGGGGVFVTAQFKSHTDFQEIF